MAKDQTVIGITGKPVPKPRTAKQQYELEKKRRMEKHLGKNVGGTQYKSDVNPYYNPRQRTFEEFMAICEARVPVTRQSGDFRYPGKTGEEKGMPKATRLSKSENPADRRRGNKMRSRLKASADSETARASSDARQKLYRSQQRRANDLAQQNIELRNRLGEDFELDEIAQVPAGKKLRYKGGEPLPPAHKKSLETIQKMNRGIYPDPKPEQSTSSQPQPERRKRRIEFLDRSRSSDQGNSRRGPRSRFEEFDIEEGIGMTMASALGNPPPVSRRMKLKQALIQREIEKNTEKNKRKRFSGKAADPNVNTRRGPGARK